MYYLFWGDCCFVSSISLWILGGVVFVVGDCGVLAWGVVPDESYAVDVCPRAGGEGIDEGDRVQLSSSLVVVSTYLLAAVCSFLSSVTSTASFFLAAWM